jgi:protein-S-isoprenylcysteine O-methyltransferase Ste14
MEARRIYAITVVQIAAAGFLAWLLATYTSPWNVERYAGTLLAVVGAIGIVLARYQLGKSFSIRPEAHELVTRGIYSKIRNPIYVFGSIMIAGIILVVQRHILWLLLAALIVAQTLRARSEARVLEEAFGDQYREYRRRTWF